jgi:hypothetical protein
MARFSYRGNRSSTANNFAGRSKSIWYDCNWDGIMRGDIEGTARFYDFSRFRLSSNINAAEANWDQGLVAFGDDGGSIAVLDALGGGVTIGSDGDNEGVSIGDQIFPFQISRSHDKLWFEVLLQTSTIADTKHGIFVGLIDAAALSATVPIAAAGTLADENFVGFHRLEGDGDKFDTVYKADGVTQVTVGADAATIVAATDIKLGIKFDPQIDPYIQAADSAKKYLVTFYADGVRLTSYYQVIAAAGTDFPNDVRLGFVAAVLNATATTPGTTTLKKAWIAQYQ